MRGRAEQQHVPDYGHRAAKDPTVLILSLAMLLLQPRSRSQSPVLFKNGGCLRPSKYAQKQDDLKRQVGQSAQQCLILVFAKFFGFSNLEDSLDEYIAKSTQLWKHGFRYRSREWVRGRVMDAVALTNAEPLNFYLRCLYCHGVFDEDLPKFAAFLDRLTSIGMFLSSEEVVSIARSERKRSGRYFHLSFDDGFKNNLTNAAPVLKERGIPATFFVPPAHIGADWSRAREYCVERLHLAGPVEILSWQDCCELVNEGFDVGSHTYSHCRLSELTGDQLKHEIVDSKHMLEDKLGSSVDHFSWPYGRKSDYSPEASDLIESAGYRGCFGAFRGRVVRGKTDPYSIPRHQFEASWPVSHSLYFAFGGREEK